MSTHTDPPNEAWMHWEAPYADSEDPGAMPPPFQTHAPRGGMPQFDFRPLFMVLEAVRRALPRELEEQFQALMREVLLTIRALIDWELQRLERRNPEPEVQDIPID